MSRLSFIGFCIENYADAVGLPGDEIYRRFKKEGLLDLLRSDYDDLHGMGAEYLIRFCEEYLKGVQMK